MYTLSDLLVPIFLGGLLPIVLVSLFIYRRIHETNKRTEIVLAAIEKNPDIDIEELLRKINPTQRQLKHKLLTKLLWGCITSFIGIGLIGFGIYLQVNNIGGTDDPLTAICFGSILLAIGIAFLINYFVGKRLLAKEIEAEEKRMTTQA